MKMQKLRKVEAEGVAQMSRLQFAEEYFADYHKNCNFTAQIKNFNILNMNTIKKILSGIMVMIAAMMLLPSLNVSAQEKLTPEMRKLVVAEIKKTLPQEVAKGMTWTDVSMYGTLMTMKFDVDPVKMGDSLAEGKAEMKGYSDDDFKKMLGSEFIDMLNMFQCDAKIILNFPDKTYLTYMVTR